MSRLDDLKSRLEKAIRSSFGNEFPNSIEISEYAKSCQKILKAIGISPMLVIDPDIATIRLNNEAQKAQMSIVLTTKEGNRRMLPFEAKESVLINAKIGIYEINEWRGNHIWADRDTAISEVLSKWIVKFEPKDVVDKILSDRKPVKADLNLGPA